MGPDVIRTALFKNIRDAVKEDMDRGMQVRGWQGGSNMHASENSVGKGRRLEVFTPDAIVWFRQWYTHVPRAGKEMVAKDWQHH